jgi:RimJ/RimL family protein N-acetyltransferase
MVLREFTLGDEALLVELDSDPRVMHYITGGVATPRAEIRDEVLPRWIRFYVETPGFGFWAAERHDGSFLGWFHLRPDDEHREDEPELGYRLKHEAWGHGYATEGGRALIDHAFTMPSVRRAAGSWTSAACGWCEVFARIGPTASLVTRPETWSTPSNMPNG